ncbi:tetratricopeptide (TPR) repeat protein [Microbacterium natoriense]|uniref:Tetratricopeptide (TPR) repeat protein n=1 Tax=Microbacterium natoriense TaxID=284570 RepID=A0AAW8F3F6_9MICO|nr:tetratricopeptide repeat protein [Microbacterium natoriense]MDQ0649424.1 tetratricopeptide (TPR) repeat protein [Microbacterium natoriense]
MTSPEERPPSAVLGRIPATPRWKPGRDKNNEAAMMLHAGRVDEAAALLGEVVALTRVADVDGEGLDMRARALLNLAAAHEFRGDLVEALRTADEGLAAASEALELIGDERATRTVQLNGMLARAQTLTQMDRLDDALAGIDDAEALLDSEGLDQRELLQFSVHNARTAVLIVTGRLQEADDEAQRALAVALSVGPALSGHAYANLGVIAQRTGDDEAAREYLQLAYRAQELSGDATSRQHAVENLARAALQEGHMREAEEGFRKAAELAQQIGLTTRLAASRTGLAAVLLQSGRAGAAAKALRTLLDELDPDAAVHERLEAYSFLGDAESTRNRYPAADDAYRAALDLARSPRDRGRINLRRAEMHAEWASMSITPRSRRARLEKARDLAIPVLLVTEALRDGLAPGGTRERWSLQVAAPARELAFRLARTLGDSALLFQLVENAAASVTLQASAAADTAVILPFERPSGPRDDVWERDELPAAAAGLVGGEGTASVRFAPPPRVVAVPGGEPVLDEWIRTAEAEYGIPLRTETMVPAW